MANNKNCLKLKIPIVAWLCGLGACAYYFWLAGPSLVSSMAAIAMALSLYRHKGAWTFSASIWLGLGTLFLTLGETYSPWNGLAGVINCIVLFYYSRSPYVNGRSTLTGVANRASWSGQGTISYESPSGTQNLVVEVFSISSSGFSCRVEEGQLSLAPLQEVSVNLPSLKEFKSLAYLVSSEGSVFNFQFSGWTLSSVRQHYKLRREVKSLIQNRAGISLMEMIVVAGLGSLMMVAVSKILLNTFEVESTAKKKFWVESIKSEIINGLRGKDSWAQIIASPANPSLSCVRDITPCDPLVNQGLIQVLDAKGGIIFDSTVARNGFNERGEACTTFDAFAGNDACPFRYEVKWTPTCSGSCINPEIRLDVALLYSPKQSSFRIDTQKHALLFYRSPIFDSLSSNCTTLNGVFNAATGVCEWTRLSSNCSSTNQVLVGFDASGNEICEPFPAVTCPAGEFITGFASDGSLQCSPG